MQNDITSIRNKCDETNSLLDQRFSDMSSKMDLQHVTAMGMFSSINVDNSDLFDTRLDPQSYADSVKHELKHEREPERGPVQHEMKHERKPERKPGRKQERDTEPKPELASADGCIDSGRLQNSGLGPQVAKVDTSGNCLEAINRGLEAINRDLEAINQKMAAEDLTRNEIGPAAISHTNLGLAELDPASITRTAFGPEVVGLETIHHADVTSSNFTKLDLVSMSHASIALHNEIGPEDFNQTEIDPDAIGLDAIPHHGLTSSNSTKLYFVSILHADPILDSLHIIFTDNFGNQAGARKLGARHNIIISTDYFGNKSGAFKLDDKYSIQKLDGINYMQLLHADIEHRNMHFIFTDIYGSLATFNSFSRSMHPTDFFVYISHGSCLFLNPDGTNLSMHIAVYQCLSMLIERLLINAYLRAPSWRGW
jgi:hypothetical protein